MSLLNRHRHWLLPLIVDGVLVVSAWYLAFRSASPARNAHPQPYYRIMDWGLPRVLVVRSGLHALRLLQPLVEIRLDPDMWTAVYGVTVACARLRPRRLLRPPGAPYRMPTVVAILDWLLLLALVATTRLLSRTLIERPGAERSSPAVARRSSSARATRRSRDPRDVSAPAPNYTPIGLVDDDPRKQGLRIHGVKVVGMLADLPHLLRDNRRTRSSSRSLPPLARCASRWSRSRALQASP